MPSCWHVSSSTLHMHASQSTAVNLADFVVGNAWSFLTKLFQVHMYLVQLHPFIHHLLDFGAEVGLLNTIHLSLLQHRSLIAAYVCTKNDASIH